MCAFRGSPASPRDAAAAVGATWGDAPCPVLVVDGHGDLVRINRAAHSLLPAAVDGDRLHDIVPSWLSEAHQHIDDGQPAPGAGPLTGVIEERLVEAHPSPSADGDVVWWEAVAADGEYAVPAVARDAADDGIDEESRPPDTIAWVKVSAGADRRKPPAAAVEERVVAADLGRHRRRDRHARAVRGRARAGRVDGERHAFLVPLVTEAVRPRARQVDHRGARTPTPRLVAHPHHIDPRAGRPPISLPNQSPTVHTPITTCPADGIPVLAGGAGHGLDGGYARTPGAVVDLGATALHVGDSQVCTNRLIRTADVPRARRVPARFSLAGPNVPARLPHVFPRAQSPLHDGALAARCRPAHLAPGPDTRV
ncbi:hypothetical protein [Streptomyces sp. NPDC040750]|uniref:hypothetical protein n=1 Tax=Streptomyces sp. NPDC040750 TaxID=3154491 RepID=UPI0033E3AE5B